MSGPLTRQRASEAPPDPRAEFHRLFFSNAPLMRVALHYGLTAEEMGLALHYARLTKIIGSAQQAVPPARSIVHFEPPKPDRIWCAQCEQRVTAGQAGDCRSRFCKAKAAA